MPTEHLEHTGAPAGQGPGRLRGRREEPLAAGSLCTGIAGLDLGALRAIGTAEVPDEGLPGVLPVTSADLVRVPEELLRPLFDAFRMEARIDKTRGRADISVTLLPETVDSVQAVAERALTGTDSGSALDRAEFSPVCLAAPAGFEPATPALGEPCSVP